MCVFLSVIRLVAFYFLKGECGLCAQWCACMCSHLLSAYVCVLLLKDLHSSVSPTSVVSCLVPVCFLAKTRHTAFILTWCTVHSAALQSSEMKHAELVLTNKTKQIKPDKARQDNEANLFVHVKYCAVLNSRYTHADANTQNKNCKEV